MSFVSTLAPVTDCTSERIGTKWFSWAEAERTIRKFKSRPPKNVGANTMPKRTRPYRDSLLEDLQDPAEAAEYLNAALNDSDKMFLVALRDVAEARQMAKVAEAAGIARESIYRTLTQSGNPTYNTMLGILRSVGLKLAVIPENGHTKHAKAPRRRSTKVGNGKGRR